MKLLIVLCLAVSCLADVNLLAPRQRAPQSAYSAGGGDFLGAPKNTYIPPNPQYLPPQNQYLPPQNQYLPPQPKPQYLPPATTQKPTTHYLPPSRPQNTYLPPQNTYLPPSGKPTTPQVPILKQINELHEDGSYKYETLTGDQTHIEQMGHIENLGTDHEEQVMHGSYSYVGDDGKTYTVTYVADANGFRAVGDHLPTPPPIPEEIQKALDKNAAEEAAQAHKGYPSGPQGYPSGRPDQTYLPPQQTSRPPYNPSSGYHY